MRKPRDLDAELTALSERARLLKARKIQQLGELVVGTGADTLPVEQLAGALLAAVDTKERAVLERWRERGAGFFRGAKRQAAGGAAPDLQGKPADDGGAPPTAGATSA